MKEANRLSRRIFLSALAGGHFFKLLSSDGKVPLIRRIRYSSTSERTRIVFDCSSKIEKNLIRTEIKNDTLLIHFKHVDAFNIYKKLRSYHVKEVRLYRKLGETVAEIRMRGLRKFKIFALEKNKIKPFRVVIDVFPDFLVIKPEKRKSESLPKRIVVIDPGHGGKDPGAVWPIYSSHPRIMEKHITLAIALKVEKHLSRYENIKVVLTRRRDVYVPLLKRAEIAAKACADAFVSIHADSLPSYPQWGGVTVFKASPRLFAQAHMLAQKVAKKVRICNDVMCWSISPLLLNMATIVTFAESRKLAESIVKSLKAHVNEELVKGIRDMRRNILVLKTPGRPAVLIETGFITNPLDRKRLVTEEYQEEIAKGIAKGIVNYFFSSWRKNQVGVEA